MIDEIVENNLPFIDNQDLTAVMLMCGINTQFSSVLWKSEPYMATFVEYLPQWGFFSTKYSFIDNYHYINFKS